MTFVSLVLIQFFKAYNFRSDRQSVLNHPFANKWLNLAIGWELLMLALIVYVPLLHQMFDTFSLARARGAEVYVCTRDCERHQALARELGAAWVGDAKDEPPVELHASIIFAPAGELVPVALRAIRKGGTLVLGGIHMSPIPSFDYSLIYSERVLRSVANNTREDGREFLAEAARIPVRTHTQVFSFDQANEALIALKKDSIRGAGVLVIV